MSVKVHFHALSIPTELSSRGPVKVHFHSQTLSPFLFFVFTLYDSSKVNISTPQQSPSFSHPNCLEPYQNHPFLFIFIDFSMNMRWNRCKLLKEIYDLMLQTQTLECRFWFFHLRVCASSSLSPSSCFVSECCESSICE
jgi:hypothetical protein